MCTDYHQGQRAASAVRGEKAAGRVLVATDSTDGEEEKEKRKRGLRGQGCLGRAANWVGCGGLLKSPIDTAFPPAPFLALSLPLRGLWDWEGRPQDLDGAGGARGLSGKFQTRLVHVLRN